MEFNMEFEVDDSFQDEEFSNRIIAEVKITFLGTPANYRGHPDNWDPGDPPDYDYRLFIAGNNREQEITLEEANEMVMSISAIDDRISEEVNSMIDQLDREETT